MGDDNLTTVVREGVEGLRKYIQLLESLLASARAAEALFPSVAASIEGVSREVFPSAQAQGIRSMNGPGPAVSEYDESYARLKAALVAERPSGQNRVLKSLRVIAAAGGGELDFGLTCLLLRETGVCRGTAENVASYISKRLRLSPEFARVGEPGSGRYRWLPYSDDHSEDVPESAADDHAVPHSQDTVDPPEGTIL